MTTQARETAYESKYIEVQGVSAHYLEAGTENEDKVLLIHGGGLHSCAELNYGYSIPYLAKRFHVIALDLPGFGFTEGGGPRHYSNAARAEFAMDFLRTMNWQAHVVGNSNGGWMTQYIGHEAPELIRRMVIVNSRSGTFPVKLDGDHRDRMSKSFFPTVDLTEYPDEDNVRAYLLDFYYDASIVTDERVKFYVEVARRNWDFARAREAEVGSSPEVSNINKQYKGTHISEHVDKLAMPILLTWSLENQSGSTPTAIMPFFSRIQDGELHVFMHAMHHVQIELADRWTSVVTEFLTRDQ